MHPKIHTGLTQVGFRHPIQTLLQLPRPFQFWLGWLCLQVVFQTLVGHELLALLFLALTLDLICQSERQTQPLKTLYLTQLTHAELLYLLRGIFLIYQQMIPILTHQVGPTLLLLRFLPLFLEGLTLVQLKQVALNLSKTKKSRVTVEEPLIHTQ